MAALSSPAKTKAGKPVENSDKGQGTADAQRLLKAMETVKTPSDARNLAMDGWRMRVNVELQRNLIVRARVLSKSTADLKTFDFLLSALEDPARAQAVCLQLGHGNGLEKALAADRLALLLGNPNLKTKLSE